MRFCNSVHPPGIAPLRHYLMEEARREGTAGAGRRHSDHQRLPAGLDLIQRVLAPAGTTVVIEDPVYHGQRNVFLRADVRLAAVPVGDEGVDIERLARVFAQSDLSSSCSHRTSRTRRARQCRASRVMRSCGSQPSSGDAGRERHLRRVAVYREMPCQP